MNMLRQIREKKGLSVSQLAAKASIPSRVIQEYEEGRQTLQLAHAKVLAKALWVGIEELMPPYGTEPAAQTGVASTPRPAQVENGQAASDQTNVPNANPEEAPTPALPTPATPPARRPEPPLFVPSGAAPTRGGRPEGRGRPPAPPSAIGEGQTQELARLAERLEIDQAQLEQRLGKAVSALNRVEAKDWIKKLRAIADEIAPSQRKRSQWPGGGEDPEDNYLAQHKGRSHFYFKLFNGDEMEGVIADYSPYTITITTADGETVLRKLAIAYYRRAGEPGSRSETGKAPHSHARDDAHQPLDSGDTPDRAGAPDTPEVDSMDEDRGV